MTSWGNLVIAKRFIVAAVACFVATAATLWLADFMETPAIKLASLLALACGAIFTAAIFTADRPKNASAADVEWFRSIK